MRPKQRAEPALRARAFLALECILHLNTQRPLRSAFLLRLLLGPSRVLRKAGQGCVLREQLGSQPDSELLRQERSRALW